MAIIYTPENPQINGHPAYLQAFKPIAGALAQFNYKLVSNGNIAEKEELSLLRCSRIRDLGLKLSRDQI